MNTENDLLGHILGSSTSTSPSSARSTKGPMLSSTGAKTVIFESAKPQQNILNEVHPSGRSIGGDVQSADLDQHGGVDAARMHWQAQ